MQLKMPFTEATEPPPTPEARTSAPPTAWDQLDETARVAALRLLARLIARMLAAAPGKEADHE